MGWGRTLLLGDIGNRLDIGDVEKEVKFLKSQLRIHRTANRDLEDWVNQLQKENGELKLYLAALIRVLFARKVIDPEGFARFVDAIDAEDGATDGQYTGTVG